MLTPNHRPLTHRQVCFFAASATVILTTSVSFSLALVTGPATWVEMMKFFWCILQGLLLLAQAGLVLFFSSLVFRIVFTVLGAETDKQAVRRFLLYTVGQISLCA